MPLERVIRVAIVFFVNFGDVFFLNEEINEFLAIRVIYCCHCHDNISSMGTGCVSNVSFYPKFELVKIESIK